MIYFLVFILLLILSLKYDFGSKVKFSNFLYNSVFLIFVLIAGFRFKVGGDTQSYFYYFESVPTWDQIVFSDLYTGRYSFLWNVFATTCKTISPDFYLLQLIQTLFVNLVLFWFIKRYTQFRFTSLLIYYLFFYLYFNMEILRESISISFFLLSYPYLARKSWLKYYLLITIAFLFHPSAVILFLIPFFTLLKFNYKNLFIILIFSVILIILLASFPEFMKLLLFSETIETGFNIYSEFSLNIFGKIVLFLSYVIFPLMIIKMNFRITKDTTFEYLFLTYFVLALSFILFTGFSRFLNYMTPFMAIYFATFLNHLYLSNRKSKRIIIFFFFILSFSPKYFYYNADTSRFYQNTIKFNLYHPYSSILDEKEYEYRQIIFEEGLREAAQQVE